MVVLDSLRAPWILELIVTTDNTMEIINQIERLKKAICSIYIKEDNKLPNVNSDGNFPSIKKFVTLYKHINKEYASLEKLMELEGDVLMYTLTKNELFVTAHIRLGLIRLMIAEKELRENNHFKSLKYICNSYWSLIQLLDADEILKRQNITIDQAANARKGGNAKAEKYKVIMDKAIELLVKMKPATGYKTKKQAISTIKAGLLEFSRKNGNPLSEENMYNSLTRWAMKHPALDEAMNGSSK